MNHFNYYESEKTRNRNIEILEYLKKFWKWILSDFEKKQHVL